MRVNKGDGGFFWAHVSMSTAYRADDCLYAVAVVIDVTKERESEQRLRRQNEAQQQLYDAIPCGIVRYTVDDGQHIVSINKKGCELLGYRNMEEFIASSGDNALMPSTQTTCRVIALPIERLRNGSKPLDFAYRYYRSDGTVGWIEGTSAYELGPEGEPMIQSAFLDVSGRRQKSHELDLPAFHEVLCSVYDEIFEVRKSGRPVPRAVFRDEPRIDRHRAPA